MFWSLVINLVNFAEWLSIDGMKIRPTEVFQVLLFPAGEQQPEMFDYADVAAAAEQLVCDGLRREEYVRYGPHHLGELRPGNYERVPVLPALLGMTKSE